MAAETQRSVFSLAHKEDNGALLHAHNDTSPSGENMVVGLRIASEIESNAGTEVMSFEY